MKLVCLEIAITLKNKGSATVSQLAQTTGFALSSVSEGVKELEKKSMAKRENRKITLAQTQIAHEFLRLSAKYDPKKILKDTREKIVLELIEPKTKTELQKSMNISGVQLSRLLKELKGVGAVFKEGKKYALNETVKKFAQEAKKTQEIKETEPYAVVLFSNAHKLKRVPLNSPAKGVLTGFSRFAEHGVEYVITSDLLIEPEHKVSKEEILIHALLASENKKDTSMCLIFYEKNKNKMEFRKLIDLSKEFKITGLFLNCIAYLDKKEPKGNEHFLPWNEFKAIAEEYDVRYTKKQKYGLQALESLFEGIGKNLEKPLKVFLIGGCNMALQGIKQATKDIDLIVKDNVDFESLNKTLAKMGFKPLADAEPAYKRMLPSQILVMEGKPRVDIFTRIVCNALALSDTMVDKSVERKYGNLSVNFVKPEDIILFKAITDREGDLQDITTIIQKQEPNWSFFLSELDRQHDNSERLYCLDVLTTLELLEERENIRAPIKNQLIDLCIEKSILYLAKKPASVKEITQKIDFPETTIRNKITVLVKKKKLKKIGGKPFKVISTGK
ncbi:MAG: hypothetical protein ABIJ74_04130 [archaeon]